MKDIVGWFFCEKDCTSFSFYLGIICLPWSSSHSLLVLNQLFCDVCYYFGGMKKVTITSKRNKV